MQLHRISNSLEGEIVNIDYQLGLIMLANDYRVSFVLSFYRSNDTRVKRYVIANVEFRSKIIIKVLARRPQTKAYPATAGVSCACNEFRPDDTGLDQARRISMLSKLV